MNLVFKVEKQTIQRIDIEQPADQSVNYLKATFIFGEDWNQEHIIKPLFRMESAQDSVSPELKDGRFLDVEGSCIVPHEVLEKYGRFFVSVLDETDGVRLPTNEVQVCIGKSGYNPNSPSVKPTPSEYETIMRDYNQILHEEIPQIDGKANDAVSTATSAKEVADSVRADADAGKFKGAKGDKGDQGIQGEQGIQGIQGIQGEKGDQGNPGKDGIDGKDAVVDKTFDATSENAVCSKALAPVFANAIKNTVSGEMIAVDDVSPIEHALKVKVSSDTMADLMQTKLKVCGKNVFDKVNDSVVKSNVTTISQQDYKGIFKGGDKGKNAFDYSSGWLQFPLINKLKQVSISLKVRLVEQGKFSNQIRIQSAPSTHFQKTFDLTSEWQEISHCFTPKTQKDTKIALVLNANTIEVDLNLVQIEFGEQSTEYEDFKSKTYPVNADGTVPNVTSVSPNMTMFSDTEGVTVNATYNVDINKKFEQMQAKLANIEALALGV